MKPIHLYLSMLAAAGTSVIPATAADAYPVSFPQARQTPSEWQTQDVVRPSVSTSSFAPSRLNISAAGGSLRFYGNLCFRSDWTDNHRGFYHLDLDTPHQPVAELDNMYYANGGGTYLPRTNEYVTVSYFEFMGERYDFQMVVFDADTWEPTRVYDVGGMLAAYDMCYNPQDGLIYGCFAGTESVANFASFDIEKKEFTIIKALDRFYDAIICTGEGEIYGIEDGTGNLNRISAEDGTETFVGNVGLKPKYFQSATYDYKTRQMYWFAQTANTAGLYTVDLSTAKATRIADWTPTLDEWCGVFTKTQYAAAGAPEAVENLNVSFPGASTSGTISFTMPTTTYSGEAISGRVSYSVRIDGAEAKSGTAAAGSSVELPLELERGEHQFVVSCSNASGEGPLNRTSIYVGYDVPSTPSGISLSREDDGVRISWQPVTGGSHGGNVDLENIRYSIKRLPDGKNVAEGISATGCLDRGIPSERAMYRYEITATDGSESSETATSEMILLGDTPSAPYKSVIDDAEHRLLYTIVDGNVDGYSWSVYETSEETFFRYKNAHTGNGADDWLISPSVHLEAGKVYAFTPYCGNAANPELMEVKAGKSPTPEALTYEVMPVTEIDNDMHDYAEYAKVYYFAPESDGDYYFGFHAVSGEDGFWLCVKDWEIGAGIDGHVPGKGEVTCTPAPRGGNSAELTVKLPSVDALGRALEGNVTKVTVRNLTADKTVATVEGASVKETVTVQDTEPASGTNEYEIICSNSYGEGLTATTSGFVGLDSPSAPGNARWRAEGDKVHVFWDAPQRGRHGGYIVPEELTYGVMAFTPEFDMLATNCPDTEIFDTPAIEAGSQQFIYYAVYGRNASGAGEEIFTQCGPLGTPYKLPFTESAAGATVTNQPWGYNEKIGPGAARWIFGDVGYTTPYADHTGDGGQIVAVPSYGGTCTLMSPLIDLGEAENTELSFWAINSDSEDVTSCEILVSTDNGMTWTLLGTLPRTSAEEWTKFSYSLDAFRGKTVSIGFRMHCTQDSRDLSLDDITVSDTSGVKTIGADETVVIGSRNGAVMVEGYNGTVEIYTPSGQLAARSECRDRMSLSLPGGIYIVRAGERRAKVAL